MSILNAPHFRTVRAPVNPLDKSTIVSIYPNPIKDVKPTLEPGSFEIAGGSYDKPAILVVGPSSWWSMPDPEKPSIEIIQSSIQIAASFVEDYCRGILAADLGSAIPGLFWVPGEHTVEQIKQKHVVLLNQARDKQNNWYKALVKMADVFWARTNGNPLSIDNDMRLAAQELQLAKNKSWMQDFSTLELKNCPFCGFLRNPSFPVCSNCKTVVDKKKYDELGGAAAI